MEDGDQHHRALKQKIKPTRELAEPIDSSSMEASKNSHDLEGDAELREESRWIIHDLCNICDPSNVNGTFSGKIPLMCATSIGCTLQADANEYDPEDICQEACVIAPLKPKFANPSLGVYPNKDERRDAIELASQHLVIDIAPMRRRRGQHT